MIREALAHRVTRTVVQLFIVAMIAAGTVFIALEARDRYRTVVAANDGPWALTLEPLPSWLPSDFRGDLERLRGLPSRVALERASWRDELEAEITANAWVAELHRLDRHADAIQFHGRLVRPVVAIDIDEAFLLCRSDGRLIDEAPAPLSSVWGIPEYRPESGSGRGRGLTGLPLAEAEASELFALLEVLWEAGLYPRWRDRIPWIRSEPRENGDRFWVLESEAGPDLVWGRSPASSYLPAISVTAKLEHLRRALHHLEGLRGVPRVRLWDPNGPMIGGGS